jgi:hypothetical protein
MEFLRRQVRESEELVLWPPDEYMFLMRIASAACWAHLFCLAIAATLAQPTSFVMVQVVCFFCAIMSIAVFRAAGVTLLSSDAIVIHLVCYYTVCLGYRLVTARKNGQMSDWAARWSVADLLLLTFVSAIFMASIRNTSQLTGEVFLSEFEFAISFWESPLASTWEALCHSIGGLRCLAVVANVRKFLPALCWLFLIACLCSFVCAALSESANYLVWLMLGRYSENVLENWWTFRLPYSAAFFAWLAVTLTLFRASGMTPALRTIDTT